MFKRFNKSFEPQFHPERLEEPRKLKESSKIFVCSVSDIFAEWTKPEWRDAVLREIKENPQHTFQLLTKQPHLIPKDYKFGSNVWIGVTVTNQKDAWRLMHLGSLDCGMRFVSFEPLLEEIPIYHCKGIDWIIVGRLTGAKHRFEAAWARRIVEIASTCQVPVFVKDNVGWKEKVQEFPLEASQ
jgi:protein gp37